MLRARVGAPARANVVAAAATTMRARPFSRRPCLFVLASSKSAPPATTTAPRPPRPPSTAPAGPSSSPKAPPPPQPPPPLLPPPKSPKKQSEREKPSPPPPHLRNPVAIAASATRTLAVPDRGGLAVGGSKELSLEAYMRLPPSAYSALDPELTRRGGGSGSSSSSCSSRSSSRPEPLPPPPPSIPTALFTLAVPRASMLGIWLEPVVGVRVEGATSSTEENRFAAAAGSGDRVRLVSTACDLRGSPAVEKLRINEVFALRFEAVLTWTSGGSVTARVCTEVWAEPVGPFRLVPRGALVAAGDALLRGLTGALLPSFLGKLVGNYERWARDPAYRREKEAMAREAEEREERRTASGGAGGVIVVAAAEK